MILISKMILKMRESKTINQVDTIPFTLERHYIKGTLLFRNSDGVTFQQSGYVRTLNLIPTLQLKFKKVPNTTLKQLMMRQRYCKKLPINSMIRNGSSHYYNTKKKKINQPKINKQSLKMMHMLFNYSTHLFIKLHMVVIFVWCLKYWELIYLRLSNVMNSRE